MDYSNLTIEVPPGWKPQSRNEQLKNTLLKVPALRSVIHKVYKRTQGFVFHEQGVLKQVRGFNLLHKNDKNAHLPDSDYGYRDELEEFETTLFYYRELKDHKTLYAGDSGKLYEHIEKVMSALLSKDNNIRSFVNFGVSYGYIDALLAKKFPEVSFYGIDRARLTKYMNDGEFGHLKNVSFLADDIFKFLDEFKGAENGVFFHTRTLTLLSKDFIRTLYKKVAATGFKYIVGMEQTGISRETLKPFEFSEDDKPSVLFRGTMQIHNYPSLLKEAGYPVKRIELVKTDHAHPDFRFLSFTAVGQ